MVAAKDLTGKVFGKLKVIERDSNKKLGTRWLCNCECGTTVSIFTTSLTRTNRPTTSCGCDWLKSITVHGRHGKPGYATWLSMVQRCTNTSSKHYKHYGGRGITVEDSWRSYENFYKDMGEKPEGMSLDRIDNNKGYCKDNCRWASAKEQNRNRRNNRLLTVEDSTKTVVEWCELLKLKEKSVYTRLSRGWSVEEALGLKPR